MLAAHDLTGWAGRRDHALLLTLHNTGARVSEITGLQRTDPTRNLAKTVADNAVKLVRTGEARSSSWPEATASPTGRTYCRRPFSSHTVIFRLQSGGGPYIVLEKESKPPGYAARV